MAQPAILDCQLEKLLANHLICAHVIIFFLSNRLAPLTFPCLADFETATKSFKHSLSGNVANFDCNFLRINRAGEPSPTLSGAPPPSLDYIMKHHLAPT